MKKVMGRYGEMYFHDEDELVGLALSLYGEYSEGEVEVFRKCLRPGFTAIDVGANIGAFTVPMARIVGSGGTVIAYEPSPHNCKALVKNLSVNGLDNVIVLDRAASDKSRFIDISNQDALHAYTQPDINNGSFQVECSTIDELSLGRCDFIKIDVDRHELQVLKGASNTISRCRPIIYFENEHDDLKEDLIAFMVMMGYRLYWHKPFQFNPDNYFGNSRNVFANLISLMNLAVPEEDGFEVNGLDEVMDLRSDDLMFDREIERFQKRIDKNPNDNESKIVVAHYHNLMQRTDKAIEILSGTDGPGAQAILGLIDMQKGNYNKDNWAKYELRYLQRNLRQFGGDRKFNAPKWDGRPTKDPVLIWCEQGFGDQIMFARFIPEVLKRAPNAVFEFRSELFELLQYSMDPEANTAWPNVQYQGKLHRLGRSLPEFKYHCSFPSLGYVLGVDNDMIRQYSNPYLFADPSLIDNWKGKGNWQIGVNPFPLNGARIGICNRGSATSERPYTRDIPENLLDRLGRLYPLFPFNSQKPLESFMMTAACISALDLIITVDTSIAHLAGALGVDTWLLLSWDPDFRWGLKGDTTIWYPSMTIFRQPRFRDWESVIDEVISKLEAF